MKPLGYIAYEGKSLIDKSPIVVIVTALNKSGNSKTGDMVQTFIIRSDVDPVTAAARQSIAEFYDNNPNLTLAELSRFTGKSVPALKQFLLERK